MSKGMTYSVAKIIDRFSGVISSQDCKNHESATEYIKRELNNYMNPDDRLDWENCDYCYIRTSDGEDLDIYGLIQMKWSNVIRTNLI